MLGLFGPKSGKIGVYKAAFIYQGPLKEDFSAGSPAINEVVLDGVLGSSGALAAFATIGATAPAGSVGREDHPWQLEWRSHKRSIVLFPLSSSSMPTSMFVTTRVGTQI